MRDDKSIYPKRIKWQNALKDAREVLGLWLFTQIYVLHRIIFHKTLEPKKIASRILLELLEKKIETRLNSVDRSRKH